MFFHIDYVFFDMNNYAQTKACGYLVATNASDLLLRNDNSGETYMPRRPSAHKGYEKPPIFLNNQYHLQVR